MHGLGHPANAAYQHGGQQRKVRVSLTCSAFTHLVLFTCVFLMFIYVFNYPNPVAHTKLHAWKFNWHPVLMVSGFVLFMGEALLAYRMLPFDHKIQKFIHFFLQTCALIAATVSLWAIITFHSVNNMVHFYNIHSICGLSTYIFFAAQWLGGVIAFMYPRLPDSPRAAFLPYHKYVGVLLFLMAWYSMLTGLMDRERIDPTPPFSNPYRIANAAGAFIIIAGAVILFHFSPVAKEKVDTEGTQRLLP